MADQLPDTDHDLLVQIWTGLQPLRRDVESLKAWRDEHSREATRYMSRVDAMASQDADIDGLQSWRDEMRGAWSGVKIGLTAVGALSGLSALLELLRIAGVLH